MDQLLDEFKEFSSTGENSTSLYLAQDIEIPSVLRDYKLTATNLWLSVGRTQSSIHYDPYHNLLCVVAGGKSVTLWSPELMPAMYPKAIYGEASNHSNVNFTSPDFDRHPKFKEALSRDVRHIAELGPGDMLFIPEGWYHQVDSTASTIAVNFWWESTFQLGLGRNPFCHPQWVGEWTAIMLVVRWQACLLHTSGGVPPSLEMMPAFAPLQQAARCAEDGKTPITTKFLALTEAAAVAGVSVLSLTVQCVAAWQGRPDGKFYEQFYGVFQDGAEAALRVMVEGKELFAKEAMKEILTDMVGVHGDFDMR
eukprot:gene1838-2509_t